jgi:glyoxylase-like metal-dependent hydrolase (beta-lactamase superfamily II)
MKEAPMKPSPIIRRITLGDYQVNTYLVGCPRTREALVIDPAGAPQTIIRCAAAEGLSLRLILNTHGHADHVAANRQLKALLKVPVGLHADDERFFADPAIRARTEAELGLPGPDPADFTFSDGDRLTVGTLEIEVLHTPGHTPGSVCFRVADNLFTGDTLFVGDVGRTDLAGGSLETLLKSLETKIIGLPPETVVWPGHPYGDTPTSTIGRERAENPYITDFILAP